METLLRELWIALDSLFQQGGWVLWLVFFVCTVLWLCIFERIWFFRFEYPRLVKRALEYWTKQTKPNRWIAQCERQFVIAEVELRIQARVKIIHTLIVVCPLTGLLGTVTGMINLFDLISLNGNSDVQAMSAGIYQAILPTLAGLVVGLSGYYFALRISQKAERCGQLLRDNLVLEHECI